MEYAVLLSVHIAGALITGVVMLAALIAAITHKAQFYRSLSLLLAVLTGFDLVTGTGLAVFSPTITVASVCSNIAVYVGFAASIQVLLYMRMKRGVIRFPSIQTISSYGISASVLIAAAALGF